MNRHCVKTLCLTCVKSHRDKRTLALWRFVNKLIEKGWLTHNPWETMPHTMRNLVKNIEEDNEFIRSLMSEYGIEV